MLINDWIKSGVSEMNTDNVKERPILMNGAMVRATLDGSKTQTRRAFKQKFVDIMQYAADLGEVSDFTNEGKLGKNDLGYVLDFCPYGKVGDRLWVRETTYAKLSPCENFYLSNYTADDAPVLFDFDEDHKGCWKHWWYWKNSCPSIHMPRWASRIQLEIVSVRVERLNDISEADATQEGLTSISNNGGLTTKYGIIHQGMGAGACWDSFSNSPVEAFCSLWESINGAGSWSSNPWVWVIEFKVVQ